MTTLPSARQRPAAVAEFLDKLRERGAGSAAAGGAGRLIFALDATASREPSWDRACHIQHEMFTAAAGFGGLSCQLAFFRGYTECKASRWVASAAELHRVMSQVKCDAGNTQIAKVLIHTLRETGRLRVAAVVLVGDAVEELRDELLPLAARLGEARTPVFCLHEGYDPLAEAGFRGIAAQSHGVYLPFDLTALDRLRELFAAIAVFAAGGLAALEKYAGQKPAGGRARRPQPGGFADHRAASQKRGERMMKRCWQELFHAGRLLAHSSGEEREIVNDAAGCFEIPDSREAEAVTVFFIGLRAALDRGKRDLMFRDPVK